MIKLENKITIQPPPYTEADKVITPDAIIIDELDVIYHDQLSVNTIVATFANVPGEFVVLKGDEYKALNGEISHEILQYKLLMLLGEDVEKTLNNQFPKTLEQDPNGPGSILTNMIKTIGIKSSSNCSCRKHAIEMNDKGPDWCEENIGTILAWIKEESTKRKLPYVEFVAKSIVQRAIYKSRKIKAAKEIDAAST